MPHEKGLFDTGALSIILVLLLGAVGAVIAIEQGWVSAQTIGQYGVWALLGLIAIFAMASGTRTKYDDTIVSFLLFLSIGGVISTWLVNNGYVSIGYMLMGGMLLIFLVVLALYSKEGYRHVRGARF